MKVRIFLIAIVMVIVIVLFTTEVMDFEAAALDYEVTDTSVVFTAKGFTVFAYTIELSTGRNIEKNLILFKDMSKVVNIYDVLEEEYFEFCNSECTIKNVNVKLANNVLVKSIIILLASLVSLAYPDKNNTQYKLCVMTLVVLFSVLVIFVFGGWDLIGFDLAENFETHQFMVEVDGSLILNYEMAENKFGARCYFVKEYEAEEIPLNATKVQVQDMKSCSKVLEEFANIVGRFLCAMYAIAIYETIEEKRKRNQKLESTS